MLFDQKSIKAVIFTILFLNQCLLLDYTLFLIVLFSIMLHIIDTTYLVYIMQEPETSMERKLHCQKNSRNVVV
jgi:hypothetical protein